MKNATTIVLLIFVAVTIGYLVVGGRGNGLVAPREAASHNAPSREVGSEVTEEDDPATATELTACDETAAEPAANGKSNHKVTAYYFHRTQRCHTCLTMEAYAEQALKDGLADALESGELEWRVVNVEESEHEHFVKEYELYASAVVMVETEAGQVKRSKKLGEIWDLVGDEWKFKTFIRDEAQTYLGATP